MTVKICGITRAADAQLAAELGATAVGFVFWPGSPRAVTPEAARRIVEGLPPELERVGVFVDADVADVEAIAFHAGLTTVQLQGAETRETVRALAGALRVIKAVGLSDDLTEEALDGWGEVRLLLDAHDPVRHGGTGRPIDWDRAAVVARRRPVILAGGLTPANVADAVVRVRPAGVDVSSGVEAAPGVKDPARLKAFFDALAQVEA